MAVSHSPSIVKSGLVFHIDVANTRSYIGPVITNLALYNQVVTLSATGISITAGSETVEIAQIGSVTSPYAVIQNNYTTSYTGSVSSNCCPNPFQFANPATVSPNTKYTYAIVYKTGNGYNHTNFMYRQEYTAANVIVTEAGIHDTNKRVHLGDNWYWAWNTFTTAATTAKVYCNGFHYNWGVWTDKMYVAKVLIAAGDYTSLHPKYWPAVNSSTSTTAAIKDLTSNNTTVTVSTLTYATDGSYSFNGSSDYVTFPSVGTYSNYSIEMWVKMNSLSGQQRLYSNGGAGTFTIRWDGSDFNFHFNPLDGSPSSVQTSASGLSYSTGTWYHLTATNAAADATTGAKFYVNGALAGTTEPAVAMPASASKLGCDSTSTLFANCSIALFKIYSTTLSATDVNQNFQATRSRFGV